MNHVTSIGLDVHARSITAAAFNPLTGEVTTKRFAYDALALSEWISRFESPKAVYESGVTGFDLARARQRLNMFLMRHGCIYSERNPDGTPKSAWTKSHWEWVREASFEDEADQDALALYMSEVRHLEAQKKQLENFIRREAGRDRWRLRVESLRCLKGIETATAFALVAEACVFSRFGSAKEYASWLGLAPSEHPGGEIVRRGGITKCGNSLCRRLLVEASWHYSRATPKRKAATSPEVPLSIENHAAKGVKRLVSQRRKLAAKGKRPAVANVATARELACFVWAIGRMAEGAVG